MTAPVMRMTKGSTYYVATRWRLDRDAGIWTVVQVERVMAITGGAKAPKVAYQRDDGSLSFHHWTFRFDGQFGECGVHRTREAAMAATMEAKQ